MSHFNVLVIGDDVAEQLQPYHEYECTGTEDRYVQDVDETEELRRQYEEGDTLRLRDPEGTLFDPYEERFYRHPAPGESATYDGKVRFVPDGWSEVRVPMVQAMTFREFVRYETEHEEVLPGGRTQWGWTEVTSLEPDGEVVRVVDRTNPNKKWDWWEVGGRWRNYLILKSGAKADTAAYGEIDWEAKREEARSRATDEWVKADEVIAGRSWRVWEDVLGEFGVERIDEARETYHSQDVLVSWRQSKNYQSVDRFAAPMEEYVNNAVRSAGVTFAVVKLGKWYEKGEMGWWGGVSGEKDAADWNREFWSLFEGVDDGEMVTVVDCHT